MPSTDGWAVVGFISDDAKKTAASAMLRFRTKSRPELQTARATAMSENGI